jgi:hypothetical protein
VTGSADARVFTTHSAAASSLPTLRERQAMSMSLDITRPKVQNPPAVFSALLLHGVRTQRSFVDFGAPAGAAWKHNFAVLDPQWPGQELRLPGHFIDVQLPDAEIGNDRSEMRSDHD